MQAGDKTKMMDFLEMLPDPALLHAEQGRVMAVNPAFSRLLRWSVEELNQPQCPYAWVEKPARDGACSPLVVRRRSKEGQVYDFSISYQEQGPWRLEILRDITPQMKQCRRLEALLDISIHLAGLSDYDRLFAFVGENIRHHLRAEGSSIILVDHACQEFFFRWSQPCDSEVGRRLFCTRFPLDQGIAGRVVRSGEPAIVDDVTADHDFYGQVDEKVGFITRSLIYVPLKVGGRVIGVLGAVNRREENFGQRDLEMLLMLANTVALSVENARVKELERLACTDPLTCLANRRHLQTVLGQEFSRSLRNLRPLSLLMIDLDNFKQVNDSLGHPVGDRLLCLAAEAIRGMLREHDQAARWGGDEFAVILPGCDRNQATVTAERLRRGLRQALPPELGFVGVTLGVATMEPTHPLAQEEELLNLADQALLAAKRAGRDRVMHADHVPGQQSVGEDAKLIL